MGKSTPLADPSALIAGARFLARLPSFLRRPVSLDEARATNEAWLRDRNRRFLRFARRAVFDRRRGAMRALFDHAGATHADLVELVGREGLEGALDELLRQGVYVTVDEFKGRTPMRRGSFARHVGPDDLRNPLASFHVAARSGGSRSRSGAFLIDLGYVRAAAIACAVYLDAHGVSGAAHATWEVSGAGSRFRLLKYASLGEAPAAWFTPVDPKAPGLDPVFRVSETAMRWGARIAGVEIPGPTLASGEDPLPVARWMREVIDGGRTPHTLALTSAAVRLAAAAARAGIDLAGAVATLGGEPSTAARLATIRTSGLRGLPRYGSIEAGPVGYACGAPGEPDEVHLVRPLHALAQPQALPDVPLPEDAVLLTALHEAAPYAMINFSMGDRADVSPSACGCPVHAVGWDVTLRRIRSFEKFTVAGTTFDDALVVRLLERVLPERFGGGPTDYQLVESEGPGGEPILRLRVHPRVGDVDAELLWSSVLSGLGDASPAHRLMERWLETAVDFELVRAPPLATRSGKVLHVHVENRAG